MPVFEMVLEEEYNQVLEEIWHAYRTVYRTRTYRVVAEDEEEAEELIRDGYGDLLSQDEEIGDQYDSDYREDGDVVNEEFESDRCFVIPPVAPTQATISMWPGRFVGSVPTTTQQREPDWEV
jgi:hypothetical protein